MDDMSISISNKTSLKAVLVLKGREDYTTISRLHRSEPSGSLQGLGNHCRQVVNAHGASCFEASIFLQELIDEPKARYLVANKP
jgi:hypothetical protein